MTANDDTTKNIFCVLALRISFSPSKFQAMNESNCAKLDERLARIRSNEETSFDFSDSSYNLPDEDVSRRLGAFVLENIASCALRSLYVGVKDLLVASLSNSDEYPLLEYLRSSQCGLTELKLKCTAIPDECQALLHHIPAALLVNQSVSRLELALHQHDLTSVSFAKSILDSLPVRPLGTLQELDMKLDSMGQCEPSEQVLEVLSTYSQLRPTRLKTLCLNFIWISKKTCEVLFLTLQACTFSVKFTTCRFDKETNEFLANLMESEKIREDDEEAGVVEISFDTEDVYCYDCSIPPCLFGCFRVPRNGRIRVVELPFASNTSWDVPLVAYHLPMTLYLRKLEIAGGDLQSEAQEEQAERIRDACQRTLPAAFLKAAETVDAVQTRQLLDGVRQNGSLHEFILDDKDVMTPEMNQKVQAYLVRNQKVPQLLSRPCIGGDSSKKNDTNDTVTSDAPTKTDLTCFPPLMVAATMAPAMLPTNVLIGLAAASMAERMGEFRLGHGREQAKRKRCDDSSN